MRLQIPPQLGRHRLSENQFDDNVHFPTHEKNMTKSSQPQQNNLDQDTVSSFGYEWNRHNQSDVAIEELREIFEAYFSVFPWEKLPENAEGFDMGCGSGRWAKFVAPRVGKLNCIDPSAEALSVARANLKELDNVALINSSVDAEPLQNCSQDFGYSLGVLHHVPRTADASQSCCNLLKPNAPFLLYLYYRFDNRPRWFVALWWLSNRLRQLIAKLPYRSKSLVTDIIALIVYWPLSRMSWLLELFGFAVEKIPLSAYRHKSFYMMRTDSLDRFGTPLEQRFTRKEIQSMMESAGLTDIEFRNDVPYWCAVGFKS